MPTYEYRCPNGHHFDLFQKMSDEPRASCPECGSESERILSGGAGFLFKGDGFYITDYRSESYKKAANQEKGSGGGESAKGSEGKKASRDGGSGDGGEKPSKPPPAKGDTNPKGP